MISREYGGPSKIGPTTRLSVSAASAEAVELISVSGGDSFSPQSFVIKASVDLYVMPQNFATSSLFTDTSAFELSASVYWRMDVDRPEERFFCYRGITSDGYVKITKISGVS